MQDNLAIFKDKLEQEGCFKANYDRFMKDIVKSLKSKLTLPMKMQLVAHYFCVWASQFRKPIVYDGNRIPINSIAFLFSYSGSGKDTTKTAICDKIFGESFSYIGSMLKIQNEEQAELKMQVEGAKNSAKFIKPIPPLEIGISTPEGLLKSIENLNEFNFGSLNLISSEFMSEFATNAANMPNLLSHLAELYDVGKKTSKQLKDKTNEVREIKETAVSALFISSFDLLQDIAVKRRLTSEFKTKFARRSSVTFNRDKEQAKKITDLSAFVKSRLETQQKDNEDLSSYSEYFRNLTINMLQDTRLELNIDLEAQELLVIYKEYCAELGQTFDNIDNLFVDLNVTNRFFQALKLAGALSLVNQEQSITKKCLVSAINTIEMINEDYPKFQNELNKDAFEIIMDYCHMKDEAEIEIPVYILKNANLISAKTIRNDLSSIIQLANSKDELGVYETDDNCMKLRFKKIIKTNGKYGISWKKNTGSKEQRAKSCADGFKYTMVEFNRLEKMLKQDITYSAFEYKDGKRSADTLIPTCNLLVYDVDKSDETIDEVHSMLRDIKHIISTTSDRNNPYKFRIILALDSFMEINSKIWAKVVAQIARDYLPRINYDALGQSQISFAYKDSIVYMNENGESIKIKDYVNNVREGKLLVDLTPKAKTDMRKDIYATFHYAYDQIGEGSRNKILVRAINDGYDLEFKFEELRELIIDMNSKYLPPLDEKSLNNVLKHLYKKYGKEWQ